MKKLVPTAILLLVLSLFSCSRDYSFEPLLEPIFNTDLPSFPLAHLYIVEREYAYLAADDTHISREDYFERRLIELFPHISYRGMMHDAKVEAQVYELSFNQYTESVANYNTLLNIQDSSSLVDDYQPYVSYEQEVINLNLSTEEMDALVALNTIAFSCLNKNQMDSVFHIFNRFWFNKVNSSHILIPLSIVSHYSIFRIFQSKTRAEQKAEFYFPENMGSGQKGDAFRHVFVSMHLRRYLGRMGSAMVMSAYEYFNPNLLDRDRYMDLHNNRVGRGSKYWIMRGDYIKHRNDWGRWALNASNFINNSKNGKDMDWENEEHENCKSDAETVSSKKYIFYK